MLAIVVAFPIFANSFVSQAKEEKTDEEKIIEMYATCNYDRYITDQGDRVVHITGHKNGINDVLVLEEGTQKIFFNGEEIGSYTKKDPVIFSNRRQLAYSGWNYMGANAYKINATGAGITAAAIAILAGLVGGPAAAAALGGLSAFVGTSVTGELYI